MLSVISEVTSVLNMPIPSLSQFQVDINSGRIQILNFFSNCLEHWNNRNIVLIVLFPIGSKRSRISLTKTSAIICIVEPTRPDI